MVAHDEQEHEHEHEHDDSADPYMIREELLDPETFAALREAAGMTPVRSRDSNAAFRTPCTA